MTGRRPLGPCAVAGLVKQAVAARQATLRALMDDYAGQLSGPEVSLPLGEFVAAWLLEHGYEVRLVVAATGSVSCPRCERDVLLRKDGSLRIHKPPGVTLRWAHPDCPGSATSPANTSTATASAAGGQVLVR